MDRHRKQFRRIEVDGVVRFLTFSCFNRLPFFTNPKIADRFVQEFERAALKHQQRVLAWVVMPEHLHLIVHPEKSDSITPFLSGLKRTFARDVIARWRELRAPILKQITDRSGTMRFWLPGGGYDRLTIHTELFEKIRYCHSNPVTRGLVKSSIDYRWSSARAYEGLSCIGPPIAFDLIDHVDHELT